MQKLTLSTELTTPELGALARLYRQVSILTKAHERDTCGNDIEYFSLYLLQLCTIQDIEPDGINEHEWTLVVTITDLGRKVYDERSAS